MSGLIPSNASGIPGGPARVPGTPSRVPSGEDLSTPSSVSLRNMKGQYTTGGFGWEWHNLTEFIELPQDYEREIADEMDRLFRKLAEDIEKYAKDNAPWQDQTGDARTGLKTLYIRRRDQYEIDLGHSVSYGFYLENHNGGQYAIIDPTLRHFAPEMMNIAALGGENK